MKEIILTISVVLFFVSLIPYIAGILKGRVKPRPLSWLGWAMLLGVGIFSQIYEDGFNVSMLITIASSISCFIIFFISLIKNNFKNKKIDYVCFILGIMCMIVYIVTRDPLITTVLSISADFLVGIPTILNVYKVPKSENMLSWGIGTFAIFLSFIIALTESDFLLKIYPTYLFFFNALIFVLCFRRFNFSKRI